jgi:hypothetical protein
MTDLNTTMQKRTARHGGLMGVAEVSQHLKDCIEAHLVARGKTLAPDQQEALDMIFHKIGRIINGDPDYADSWVDIAGYAQLVANRLNGQGVQ